MTLAVVLADEPIVRYLRCGAGPDSPAASGSLTRANVDAADTSTFMKPSRD